MPRKTETPVTDQTPVVFPEGNDAPPVSADARAAKAQLAEAEKQLGQLRAGIENAQSALNDAMANPATDRDGRVAQLHAVHAHLDFATQPIKPAAPPPAVNEE